MGVTTDFFVATRQQLSEVFIGWHTVSADPTHRDAANPFTGEAQVVNMWERGPLIAVGEVTDLPDIRSLPHVMLKHMDHVKLGSIHHLLTGDELFDSIDKITKPALLHPDCDDIGLHEIPQGYFDALADADGTTLDEIAQKWQQTEECQLDRFEVEDCKEILLEFSRLVKLTLQVEASMYLLWCV